MTFVVTQIQDADPDTDPDKIGKKRSPWQISQLIDLTMNRSPNENENERQNKKNNSNGHFFFSSFFFSLTDLGLGHVSVIVVVIVFRGYDEDIGAVVVTAGHGARGCLTCGEKKRKQKKRKKEKKREVSNWNRSEILPN